jgi:transcriptional regulator with XRE-family HTH domain
MLSYLRNFLELAGIPQNEVARALGISQNRVSRAIAGRLAFTVNEREGLLESLASLGVEFDRARVFECTRRGVRVLQTSTHIAPLARC